MYNNYKKLSEEIKLYGDNIALAFGCFDVLHTGHIAFIEKIRKQTKLPVFIGVLSDKTVSDRKGKDRPFFSEQDRSVIMSSLKNVDKAFIICEYGDFEIYKKEFELSEKDREFWSTVIYCLDVLRPAEFYYSTDFKMTEKIEAFFSSRNIKKTAVPYAENISSTEYIQKMKNTVI